MGAVKKYNRDGEEVVSLARKLSRHQLRVLKERGIFAQSAVSCKTGKPHAPFA